MKVVFCSQGLQRFQSDVSVVSAASFGTCGRNSQTVSSWSQSAIKMAAAPLLRSAACSQVLLAACVSVEFLPFSPYPHGTGRGNWHLCPPYMPGWTCPEQTAARDAEGGLVPDALLCSNSLTKDGVGSTERSCLDKSMNEWAQNQFNLFCIHICPPFQPSLKLTKVPPSFVNICSCSDQDHCCELK